MLIVHQHVLHAGVSQRARQRGLPHPLGQPHAARANAELGLQERAQPLDLTPLVGVGQDGEDRLVESTGQQLDAAAGGELTEQVERRPGMRAQPLEQAARAVHGEPHFGAGAEPLEERPVGMLGGLGENAVEVPDRLVVVNAEAECQRAATHSYSRSRSRWTTPAARPSRSRNPLQLLDQRHRAMSPSRAADRDREIRLALALVGRQHEAQEVLQTPEELAALLGLHDEVPHPAVAAVQRPQRLHEVRVGQEADVEHQIGVERDAVLEAERHQRDGQARPPPGRDVVLDEQVLELVHGERGRVHHAVGDLAERGEHLALGADAVEYVAVGRQRVPAARLPVAAHQRLLARLQEQDLGGVAPLAQLGQRVEQVREVFPLADVHAERHAIDGMRRAGDQVGEGGDERGGEVVHAEEPHVLEALDRVALAGAAHAGDDHEGDRAGHRG